MAVLKSYGIVIPDEELRDPSAPEEEEKSSSQPPSGQAQPNNAEPGQTIQKQTDDLEAEK